jgi:hypothetical protein
MYVKRLAGAAAIAIAAGMFGVGPVNAAPSDPPPPCSDCQPGPGGPGNGSQDNPPPAPPCKPLLQPRRVGPGSPRGGGQPSYRQPWCAPAPQEPAEPGT